MGMEEQPLESGLVVTRQNGKGGPMITVSILMPELDWGRLTEACRDLWSEAQDDIDLRDLTLEERIVLFVGGEVDFWYDRWDAYTAEAHVEKPRRSSGWN